MSATILHISDIHRTEDEAVESAELLHWLTADLKRHTDENIPAPDVVVVSGDLTQAAEPSEYAEARTLLTGLLEHLELPAERLVIVPGNHDVHWPTCENHVRRRREPRNDAESALFYTHGGSGFAYESEAEFQARLANFRTFYEGLYGRAYPEQRSDAYTKHAFDDLGLAFFGISSVDLVDQDRNRGGFHPSAVAAASKEAARFEGTCVAVWHHDLDWDHGVNDCLPSDDLRLLSAGSFLLGLCGHTHRPASNDVCRIQGYPLPVVSAGSLCAGPRQRPESTPRSYNVIHVENGNARVWVRVKDRRSDPWRDCCSFGTPQNRQSYYDVPLGQEASSGAGTRAAARRPGELRAPNPFSNANAKAAQRGRVLDDYVWTRVADDVRIDLPQIIVGTRGSGKTALLFTLTLDWQLRSIESQAVPLDIVGLYCQMKVNEVSAFNGKGGLSRDVRKALFRASVATMWSTELVDVLTEYNRWRVEQGGDAIPESDIASLLSKAWGVAIEDQSLATVRRTVRQLRDDVLKCLSLANTSEFDAEYRRLTTIPLLRGGLGPLSDAAAELRTWETLQSTRWTVLFDEVEFLNPWQQECVYEHMSNPSGRTSCKVATLPYAHSRALSEFPSVLVLGDDYGELSVVIDGDSDFEKVAKGLWKSRLAGSPGQQLSLEEAWPEEEYHLVLGRYLLQVQDKGDVDALLIQDLRVERRARAEELRAEDPKKFGEQFKRKFQEPFRFRLADRNRGDGPGIPLYWGWRQMLKSCGTNPRQFLGLAEICWRNYWSDGGIRPLSAEEQFEALQQWATAFTARCSGLPHKGHELQEIVTRIARKLSERLYNPVTLRNEHLTVHVEDCSQEQAEAIAGQVPLFV